MTAGESSLTGTVREKWYFWASASKYIRKMESVRALCHPEAWMAPSKMDLSLSGITRSASATSRKPKPVQLGQAPLGLLKENILGSSSVRLMPQSSQA